MGVIDTAKRIGRKVAGAPRARPSENEKHRRPRRGRESLPGGGSGKEASEASPQRAAELAD